MLLTGCATGQSASAKQKVVASAAPLFDALGSVGGKRVHATNVAPLDLNAPLTPARQKSLREASLAVIIGGGVQPEIERIAAERTGPTIRLLDNVTGANKEQPYVWLDPTNMMLIASEIRVELTRIDPSSEKTFRKNEARMARLLFDILRINQRTLATCEQRSLVTTSSHFGSLTSRFDIDEVVVSESALPEAIRQTGATTVFFQSLPSLDEAKRIKSDLGVRSATLDDMAIRTDQARRGGASYGSLMALNLDALRAALDCKKVRLGDK